jgi:hypothetical protein
MKWRRLIFTDSIDLLSAFTTLLPPTKSLHWLPAEGSLFYSTSSTPFCTLAGSAAILWSAPRSELV